MSIRQIAVVLDRSPSTISRELRRNTVSTQGYMPNTAHRLSVQRRERPRRPKLVANAELQQYVQGKLEKKWSPQQISNRLAKDFPTRPEMRVCTETIYQAIYVHAGHWEGDLIIGAGGRSAIATLVERSSRYVMLGHLGRERSAEAVRDSLITTVAELPASLRGTLTWDQGAEMAEHRAFSIATDFDVYFADPGSPWQRGSNENTNGLLRQYFPKGTDLAGHDQEHLLAIAEELNGRPRKTLDWDTPAERLAALLDAS